MKRVQPQPDWPQSWNESYFYDQSEIYGEISHYGYAYAYENRRRETLRLLMEKGLVRIAGRDDSLGRPVLYGTTKKFMQIFGLRSLKDLPRAEEFNNMK